MIRIGRLDDETVTLLRRLEKMTGGGSWWQRWLGASPEDLILLLKEIFHRGRAGVMAELLPMVWWPDFEVARTVAAEIAGIMSGTDPDELWRLDKSLRERGFGYGFRAMFRWGEIRPEHLETLPTLSQNELGWILGLLSSHPDGYVREASISRLRLVGGDVPFPFLMIRCSDWVPVVREQAWAAVQERLVADQAPTVARHLALLETMRRTCRIDFQNLAGRIDRFAGEALSPTHLEAIWRTADRRLRRALARRAADWPVLTAPLTGLGKTDTDPVVRTLVLQSQIARGEKPSILAWALADRAVGVRRLAWRQFRQADPDSEAILKAGLLDPHPSLREEARFWAGRTHRLDALAIYRNTVESFRSEIELIAGLSGLGEAGTDAEADRVAGFLDHPRPRVAAAALRAVARLAPERWRDRFLELLARSQGAPHKLAAMVLRRHPEWIDGAGFTDLIRHQPHDSAQKRLFGMLQILGKWDCMVSLLELAMSDTTLSRSDLQAGFASWLQQANRSQRPATAQQMKKIAHLWPGAKERISAPLAASLEFFLSIPTSSRPG